MRRMWTTAAVLALAASSASITYGEGWLKTKWRGFVRDTQRNNAWPEAFVPADRARVRDPFAIQTANGWRHQNTLGDQHFDPETGTLNEAGRLKVRSILALSPPEYRTIFLVRNLDPSVMATRMASVYDVSSHLLPPGGVANVSTVEYAPRTTPSRYIDAVNRSYDASTPVPRIGQSGSGGGGGAGMMGAPNAGS